ncbi:MAG: hypothetical protein JWO36_3947 [Myxococcales bacterium]|nr:hypothetical protein [Myxococcales bacterium]
MVELVPCPQCHRHVAVGEAACPFCGAAPRLAPKRLTLGGRLSRAAVFASATLVACSKKEEAPKPPPVETVKQEAPPPAADAPPAIDAQLVDAAVAAEPPADAAVDAGVPKKHRRRLERGHKRIEQLEKQPDEVQGADVGSVDRGACCKPYGAPPARRRLV